MRPIIHVLARRFGLFPAVAALSCVFTSEDAAAICLGSEDPVIVQLELAIGRDPATAADVIADKIANTDPARNRRLAELYILRKIALAMSGRPSSEAMQKARQAAGGLDPSDPVRLFIRMGDVARLEAPAEQLEALKSIQAEYRALPNGSPAKTCMAADLGFQYGTLGEVREAFAFGSEAYRNSDREKMSRYRAEAASRLASIVSAGFDFEYAQELHSEALKIQLALGMTDLAANELLMRGYTDLAQDNWREAIEDFRASAEQAQTYGSQYAVDYAAMGICEAALKGEALDEAGPACEQAYAALKGPGEPMSFAATALMAKVFVERGNASGALRLLDPLVRGENAEMMGEDWIFALTTQAQALSMLNRNAEAYASLRRASAAAAEYYEGERRSGVSAMRTRFKTEELQNSLSHQQRTSDARLRLALVVIIGALTTVTLLGTLIFILLRHRRRFRRLAMTDPLTGLCNRRATLERADEALRNSTSDSPRASLALIDLDQFKACNDAFGHEAGDQVLSAFARIIESNVRPGDVAGRWGGEEFLLIAPGTTVQETVHIIERIRTAAEQERFDFASGYRLRFSAGVARLDETERMDGCISLADRRLYLAKERGRDQTCTSGEEDDLAPAAEKGLHRA